MVRAPEPSPYDLHTVVRGAVLDDTPLARFTTMRVGGPARHLVRPADEADLAACLQWCRQRAVPFRVVGLGSNLLVPDHGYEGVALSLLAMANRAVFDGCTVQVGAGYPMARLVQEAARRGLGGLLGLAGIPGSVGGALAMNAGTPRGEARQVVRRVRTMGADGVVRELSGAELRYAYRHSVFLEEPLVALSATLELAASEAEREVADLKAYLARRNAAQPVEWPNTGSVWTNPPGAYAGRLIEEAGLKGACAGGAQISPKHANFIVNLGQALATDVVALMARTRQTVRARTGITLQPEVRWLDGQEELERLLAAPPDP